MKQPPPDNRAVFALNLRRLRIEHGYRSARSFARQLGIDENRYTRYERGETEPDITLLSEICRSLGIKHSDLLEPDAHGISSASNFPMVHQTSAGALHEAGDAAMPSGSADETWSAAAPELDERRKLMWRLSEWAITHLESQATDVLQRIEQTAKLYTELLAEPFLGIGKIAKVASRTDLSPADRKEIEQLLAHALATVAGSRSP